jgi:hypothetical protein
MRSIEVVLGGKTYTVTELPVRKNVAWRKQLQEPFGELVTALQNAPQTELGNLQEVGTLVRNLSGLVVGSVETITRLLFDYAPNIKADQKAIEDSAYESELLEAFVGVLGLAFPFGVWGKRAGQVVQQLSEIGSQSSPTLTN